MMTGVEFFDLLSFDKGILYSDVDYHTYHVVINNCNLPAVEVNIK